MSLFSSLLPRFFPYPSPLFFSVTSFSQKTYLAKVDRSTFSDPIGHFGFCNEYPLFPLKGTNYTVFHHIMQIIIVSQIVQNNILVDWNSCKPGSGGSCVFACLHLQNKFYDSSTPSKPKVDGRGKMGEKLWGESELLLSKDEIQGQEKIQHTGPYSSAVQLMNVNRISFRFSLEKSPRNIESIRSIFPKPPYYRENPVIWSR